MSLGSNRYRRKPFVAPKLMITSMMDMFTIILIFLLFSFSDDPEKIQLENDLELPHSSAEEKYDDSIQLVFSKGSLILDGEIIATLKEGRLEGLNPDNPKASDLYQRLVSHKALLETQEQRPDIDQKEIKETKNQILFLCDKMHTFKIINPVIKTAGLAGFPNFQFAVLKE
jgi:hypothetical protein